VIVGGWSANPGVSLVSRRNQAQAYPGIAADFEHTFATLKALPCDIFLGAHGVYFNLLGKLDRTAREGPSVWVDPIGYRNAIGEAEKDFRRELAAQESID
jgi:metallo-beta-lactamase class B